ncbi:MAG: trypsin-like peptidase domain-containing protein, partial [Flavobacteriales bacterium]
MITFRDLSFGLVLLTAPVFAQESVGGVPFSQRMGWNASGVPTVQAASFDAGATAIDDANRAAEGKLPLYGRFVTTDVDPNNAGQWIELVNGDRIWRVRLTSPGALATELFFSEYHVPSGAVMHVYDDSGAQLIGGYTTYNEQADGRFSTDMIYGDACMVEYYEPAEVRGEGYFHVDRIVHAYRMVHPEGTALTGACEVDVNCTEGADWVEQRDAVVRIRVVLTAGAGYCSGTLVNNTALDCKGYVLSAFHCSEESTEANFGSYQFRFKFQRTVCGTGSSTGQSMTGCVRRADSNDGGGHNGSDFVLLELSNSIPASYTPYYAGWDATGTGGNSGVSIHHPDADVKKISTYTTNLVSTSWAGFTVGSHWRVTWAGTANGHGVTEGGSSGSPLFNSAKRVIGTLTGGSSCCDVNGCDLQGSGPTQPDYYGKMSYHWDTMNPNPAGEELHYWLDPLGIGYTLDG